MLALFGSARQVRAQTTPPPFRLVWSAPAECPDQARVQAQVEALASADGVQAMRPLEARALVERKDDGSFQLSLTLLSEGVVDQRDLVGDSCQALVDSVAVILAVQLNPGREPAAPAKPAAAPAPPAPKAAPPAPPPRPRAPRHFQLGLSGSGDSAALPRFAFGSRLDLGWSPGRWYVGLAASAWLPQEQALQAGHSGRARFGWLAASLSACHAWGDTLRLGPCLSAEVGQLTAESLGVRVPAQVAELWLAGLGGAAFWLPLGSSWLLTSSLVAVVPLRRPHFVIEGIGEIHQARAVAARSSLGLALRF